MEVMTVDIIGARQAAEILGVSVDYLIDKIPESRLPVHRDEGYKRKYKRDDVEVLYKSLVNPIGLAVIYSRLAVGYRRKPEIARSYMANQKSRGIRYCINKGYSVLYTVEEFGSGTNGSREKLKSIIQDAECKKFSVLVIESRDRLTMINYEEMVSMFKTMGVRVVCLKKGMPSAYEEEYLEDMMPMLTINRK